MPGLETPHEPHGWGPRIAEAILLFAAALRRRVGQDEFGELVAREEGRDKPYGKATVSGWTAEKFEPSIATFEAMARVVGCDPWWIVWGVGRPPTNVMTGAYQRAPVQRTKGREAEG